MVETQPGAVVVHELNAMGYTQLALESQAKASLVQGYASARASSDSATYTAPCTSLHCMADFTSSLAYNRYLPPQVRVCPRGKAHGGGAGLCHSTRLRFAHIRCGDRALAALTVRWRARSPGGGVRARGLSGAGQLVQKRRPRPPSWAHHTAHGSASRKATAQLAFLPASC